MTLCSLWCIDRWLLQRGQGEITETGRSSEPRLCGLLYRCGRLTSSSWLVVRWSRLIWGYETDVFRIRSSVRGAISWSFSSSCHGTQWYIIKPTGWENSNTVWDRKWFIIWWRAQDGGDVLLYSSTSFQGPNSATSTWRRVFCCFGSEECKSLT